LLQFLGVWSGTILPPSSSVFANLAPKERVRFPISFDRYVHHKAKQSMERAFDSRDILGYPRGVQMKKLVQDIVGVPLDGLGPMSTID
jgi:hypothetical protein